jgi:hypothetical protein
MFCSNIDAFVIRIINPKDKTTWVFYTHVLYGSWVLSKDTDARPISNFTVQLSVAKLFLVTTKQRVWEDTVS